MDRILIEYGIYSDISNQIDMMFGYVWKQKDAPNITILIGKD